ncbi:MAG: HEAT repeat domain-containing protein [Halobacteriota archaeon]
MAEGDIREKAVTALIKRLRSEDDDEVKATIIDALVGLPDPKAVRPIFDVLQDLGLYQSHMLEIAENGMNALAAIGNDEAIDVLISYMKSGQGQIRKYSTESIVKVGNPAIKKLILALQSDHPLLRANAAWALGEIGAASAIEKIILLLEDNDSGVRRDAAWALGKLGSKV